MVDAVRMGLVGFGGIGQVRARALARSPDCRLTAVHDVNADLLRVAPAGVSKFASFDNLIASETCDAVLISTPPDSHEALALQALAAGKHVLVEKPMASTLAACDRMLAAADRAGRVLTVGFNHRYFKGVQRVQTALRNGEIGNVRYFKAYAGHFGLPELRAPWMYAKQTMGGGTLRDNGVHVLDLIRFLMGDVGSVQAAIPAKIWDTGVEDNAFLHLHARSGVVCGFHSSWTAWRGYQFAVEAYGDAGMAMMSYSPMFSQVIRVKLQPFARTRERNFYLRDIVREKARGWQTTAIATFLEEFRDFRRLVAGGAGSLDIATGFDGRRVLEIAEAAYASNASGEKLVLSAR